jgi:hypothetical protein
MAKITTKCNIYYCSHKRGEVLIDGLGYRYGH